MSDQDDSEAPLAVLLVTANVGSLFEEPTAFQEPWLTQLFVFVAEKNPDFVAIHCQEVGGKSYESGMKDVDVFIDRIVKSDHMSQFTTVRAYLDEDYETKAEFTALGSIYFIHKDVKDATMWNFSGSRFHPVAGKEIKSDGLVKDHFHEKLKFPPDFFPQFPWSRKGYIRTRWQMRNKTFDMVNVHLFHDASNVEAASQMPSIYVANRKRALTYTLEKIASSGLSAAPLFIFGDFNFRLNLHGVLEKYFGEPQYSRKEDGTVSRVVYRKSGSDKPLLTLAKKQFVLHDGFSITDHSTALRTFDFEFDSFPQLFEQPVTFQPSYPFSENEAEVCQYMETRCPGWCDRVMYDDLGRSILQQADKANTTYDLVGLDACMGDHKPVALSFVWPANARPKRSASSACHGSRMCPFTDKTFLTALLVATFLVFTFGWGGDFCSATSAVLVLALTASLLLVVQPRTRRS